MVLFCFGLDINVLLCQDRAPDVEEPVVNSLEKEPAELTKGDKDEKRPDVVDVEHETGQEDDGEHPEHGLRDPAVDGARQQGGVHAGNGWMTDT